MESKKGIFKKIFSIQNILVFIISFILFFGITVLFNKYVAVYDVSGVRPSATLNPVLGIAYGWPAIIACAIGNFVSDLVSGYGIAVALMGFLPQLLYGIIPYYAWKLVAKSVSMRTRLDSPFKVIAYVIVVGVNAIPIAFAVGLIQNYVSPIDFWGTVGFAILNNFGVCLAFGLPLMVFLDFIYSRIVHKGKRKLSDNEKIILISSLCQLGVFIINIVIVYLIKFNEENVTIWSDIYFVTLITTGSILLISILCMQIRHYYVVKNAGLQIISKKDGTIYVDTKKKLEFVSFPGNVPANNYGENNEKKASSKPSYEKAFYVSVSNQKGCLMNCSFCDCPAYGFHGNVLREELMYQINTVIDTHYVSQTKYFEVDFMRMGEPSLNDEILEFVEFDLQKIIKEKIDVDTIVPNMSTMFPKNKSKVEHFILEYCRIKNQVYKGNALIQFSIHSSDNKIRNRLMNGKTLSLEEISEIANKMPIPKGYKYVLSFAVGKTLIVDADRIEQLFDKNKFSIKLTPIHATYNAIDHGYETMNEYFENNLMLKLHEEFIKKGWDVFISNDSKEDDENDLTCGKLIITNIANNIKKNNKKRTRYGIIAALKYEEELFRAELSDVKKITLLNKPAYSGIIGDNEVIIMQCGMGKVSAGICAQAMIDLYHPDFIINTGCAGALDKSLKVGDIVVSSSVVEWDLDLRKIGLPLGYIDALGCVEMKASSILSKKIISSKIEGINVKLGVIASGDQFVSTSDQRQIITENFPNALCAEMEGAAIGHVCLQNDIPFCIIRSMSDTADGDSGVDFEKFSEQSSKISAAWLVNMFKKDFKN